LYNPRCLNKISVCLFTLLMMFTNYSMLNAQSRITTELEKVQNEKERLKVLQKKDREQRLLERLESLDEQVLEGALDPKKYIIGPGDLFSVYIWGKVGEQFEAIVTPEGDLEIPTVGLIRVSNMTLEDSKILIESFCHKVYSGVDISVSLVQLRVFRIYVTGNVLNPGTYPIRAIDRISDAIEIAGGVNGLADGTNVIVTSKNGTRKEFDYLKFKFGGDLDSNIYLSNGDNVHVSTIDWAGNIVSVETYDERSGFFQLTDNEKLGSLLERTGVFSKLSDVMDIYVSRENNKSEDLFYFKDSKSKISEFLLKSGDRIIIPQLMDMVYVTGEVANPGAYPFIPDMTAKSYIGYAGGAESTGNEKGLRIIREEKKIKSKLDTIIRRGDNITVPRKWNAAFRDVFDIVFPVTTIILSAKAAGLF